MTITIASEVRLRADTGETIALDVAGWHGPATSEELELLADVDGPVIDLGCGPGRLVSCLTARQVSALGVDSSWTAVALARDRGASVIEGDLFGPLPGEGSWATALVFDGNIGIGGDPVRLLARCREIVTAHGRVLVEVGRPGTAFRRLTTRLEIDGQRTAPFAWALVGADDIEELARHAGLGLASLTETSSGRRFASLRPSSWLGGSAGSTDQRKQSPLRPWTDLWCIDDIC